MTHANGHKKFGFSSMARVVRCPGSVKLCERYPSQETEDTRNGDAAHWAWREILEGRVIDVGLVAPNGVPLTDEMCESADVFVDAVRDFIPADKMHIEEALMCVEINAENGGTPDVWGDISPVEYTVMDFKFGYSVVDVVRNWQLVNAACAIIDARAINGLTDQHTKFNFVIVQPRAPHRDGPVRVWSCLASELRSMRNVMHSACASAERENAVCFVSEECINCSARAHCPTAQRAALTACDIAGISEPLEMTPDAIGLELRIIKHAREILKARETGLEEVAVATIKSGKLVAGWRMEQGTGRQQWNKTVPEVIAVGSMMGIDLSKPSTITPKQAIKKGLPAELVTEYSYSPSGEMKLVPDDGSLARKTFGQ